MNAKKFTRQHLIHWKTIIPNRNDEIWKAVFEKKQNGQ